MFAVNRFVVAPSGTVSASAHSRRGAAMSYLSGQAEAAAKRHCQSALSRNKDCCCRKFAATS